MLSKSARLIAVLSVSFLMASCASSPPPVTEPPRPLPAEYATRCASPPPAPQGPGMNDVAQALNDMYHAYGLCAGRLVDLLDWLDGSTGGR